VPGGFPLGLQLCNEQVLGVASSAGTACAKSATANTKGAWKQLIAATAYDACWLTATLVIDYAGDMSEAFDIGFGASGSEVAVVNNLMLPGVTSLADNSPYSVIEYSFPLHVPAGTRIAARVQSPLTTDEDGSSIAVNLYDGAFTQIEGAAGVDAIGFNSSTTLGTALVPGASGAFGSYAQLTASTSRDYMGIFLGFDTQGALPALGGNFEIEVAIGASGSEHIIKTTLGFASNLGSSRTAWLPLGSPFLPINIPAGTRIAARISENNVFGTSQSNFGLTLYGVYQ
jgi:hypothetical protein